MKMSTNRKIADKAFVGRLSLINPSPSREWKRASSDRLAWSREAALTLILNKTTRTSGLLFLLHWHIHANGVARLNKHVQCGFAETWREWVAGDRMRRVVSIIRNSFLLVFDIFLTSEALQIWLLFESSEISLFLPSFFDLFLLLLEANSAAFFIFHPTIPIEEEEEFRATFGIRSHPHTAFNLNKIKQTNDHVVGVHPSLRRFTQMP